MSTSCLPLTSCTYIIKRTVALPLNMQGEPRNEGTPQHILIHYKTISSNIIQVQCVLSFSICENSLPQSFPPHHTLPPPTGGVCGGRCHSGGVGTLQAMLTEHTELEITLTTEGGVTP